MKFIIALAAAAVLTPLLERPLKKAPNAIYACAALLALVFALGSFSRTPDWCKAWVLPLFQTGTLSTALFAVVMYTGALKNGSALMKKLMPLRGGLSITASILCLGHYIYFGKTYYPFLLTQPGIIPLFTRLSMIVTLAMLVLLLPLMVTSFPAIRRRMSPTSWKKLQRWAYLFYALSYVHIILVNLKGIAGGKSENLLNAAVYTLVFGLYAILRLRKAAVTKNKRQAV